MYNEMNVIKTRYPKRKTMLGKSCNRELKLTIKSSDGTKSCKKKDP